MKKVVIVGGGFAGLEAAKQFKKQKVEVFLIDKSNHHTFQPLLYQVATAGLTPSDIAVPLRSILRKHKNTEVVLGEVTHIYPDKKCVELFDGGTLQFDYLLLATGARHSYFGKSEWERIAPGLKSVEEATEIRRRILMAFEAAERIATLPERVPYMTFVIVGAGPTGVEMAGAIAELARFTLDSDFRVVDPSAEVRILLVEVGDRVLGSFDQSLSTQAQKSLEKMGVEVRLNTRVTLIADDHVLAGEERINTYTVIWAAGVVASPLARDLTTSLDRVGRAQVEPDLSIAAWPHIFVAGDLAAFTQPNGLPVPGVAPAAL